MASQGSAGNVIAALCNVPFPGLGQLIQGRLISAAFYFVSCGVLYFLLGWTGIGYILGLLVHLLAILSAATYKN